MNAGALCKLKLTTDHDPGREIERKVNVFGEGRIWGTADPPLKDHAE